MLPPRSSPPRLQLGSIVVFVLACHVMSCVPSLRPAASPALVSWLSRQPGHPTLPLGSPCPAVQSLLALELGPAVGLSCRMSHVSGGTTEGSPPSFFFVQHTRPRYSTTTTTTTTTTGCTGRALDVETAVPGRSPRSVQLPAASSSLYHHHCHCNHTILLLLLLQHHCILYLSLLSGHLCSDPLLPLSRLTAFIFPIHPRQHSSTIPLPPSQTTTRPARSFTSLLFHTSSPNHSSSSFLERSLVPSLFALAELHNTLYETALGKLTKSFLPRSCLTCVRPELPHSRRSTSRSTPPSPQRQRHHVGRELSTFFTCSATSLFCPQQQAHRDVRSHTCGQRKHIPRPHSRRSSKCFCPAPAHVGFDPRLVRLAKPDLAFWW
jgi:hypothetical protein